MSEHRKTAQAREKDLRMAMFRIERGRAHTKSAKMSIASVAREAGVSAALIHNHYPGIADAIRQAQGHNNLHSAMRSTKSSRQSGTRRRNCGRRLLACVPMWIGLPRSTRCCWPKTPCSGRGLVTPVLCRWPQDHRARDGTTGCDPPN